MSNIRQCSVEGCEKSLRRDNRSGFCRNHRSRDSSKKWTEANKDRVRENQKVWHEANRERRLKQNAVWQTEHREILNERARAKHKEHPEKSREAGRKWREDNRERSRELALLWQKRNPEKVADYESARRARIRGLFVEKVERQIVWERDQGVCHLCQTSATPENWHLDHVISLDNNGPHCYANIAVSHASCNQGKNSTSRSADKCRWAEAITAFEQFHGRIYQQTEDE